MFIKEVKKVYQGKLRTYVYITQSYRDKGKVKHKNIAYLGALSQKEVENLVKGLSSLKEEPYTSGSLNLTHEEVLCYGDILRPKKTGHTKGVEVRFSA
jgi:hypothetical protein